MILGVWWLAAAWLFEIWGLPYYLLGDLGVILHADHAISVIAPALTTLLL
jgi:hypothetical protein